jgi:branched-chain amino acid transport system substrate-binding protein
MRNSPTQVATNYTKLISSDHDDLVFGPFSTLLTVPSSKIANRFGYALIEGAGGAPAVFATGLHNTFDVSLVIKNQLVTVANCLA